MYTIVYEVGACFSVHDEQSFAYYENLVRRSLQIPYVNKIDVYQMPRIDLEFELNFDAVQMNRECITICWVRPIHALRSTLHSLAAVKITRSAN